jgi:Asp-tRNA(Asn)/Glu-tRNA(Gln) amidotransferase A subunit family amidase
MSAGELLAGRAVAIAAAVRARTVSAAAMVEASLARIAAIDPAINAFTDVVGARARAQAEALDKRLEEGRAAGAALPLAGVPFAVKNLFDVAGLTTRAGSRIERDNAPALVDAPLVARLERAGAVLVGALNMDEYAYGFTTSRAWPAARRAARPQPSPPARSRSASGPTPTARSACRHRCAASSA